MGRAYLTVAPHPPQNFDPGFTCAPQEVQNFALGAAGGSEGFCTSGAAGGAAGAGAGATTGGAGAGAGQMVAIDGHSADARTRHAPVGR